jgi:hypothetical protein
MDTVRRQMQLKVRACVTVGHQIGHVLLLPHGHRAAPDAAQGARNEIIFASAYILSILNQPCIFIGCNK